MTYYNPKLDCFHDVDLDDDELIIDEKQELLGVFLATWSQDEIQQMFFEQFKNLIDEYGIDHVMDKINSGEGVCLSREDSKF